MLVIRGEKFIRKPVGLVLDQIILTSGFSVIGRGIRPVIHRLLCSIEMTSLERRRDIDCCAQERDDIVLYIPSHRFVLFSE